MNNDLKQKLKTLRHFAPRPDKREAFRAFLSAHVRANAVPYAEPPFIARVFALLRTAPVMALVIAVLAGSGSGAALASQNALPGQMLYPVKLATEGVRLAVTRDQVTKTELRLEFASRRLDEVEQILDKTEAAAPERVQAALARYETALAASGTVLSAHPEKAPEIAEVIEKAAVSHERTIRAISEKIRSKEDRRNIRQQIEKASEQLEDKSDAALLTIISSTTTPSEQLPKAIVDRSRERVKEKEEKFEEAARVVKAFRSAGETLGEADEKLKEAGKKLESAREKLEEGELRASLEQSIEARKLTRELRKLAEEKRKEREKEHDERERKNEREDREERDDQENRNGR